MPETLDRFVSPCAPPEGRQREVATILTEECAEVSAECAVMLAAALARIQQRASKLLRFGITEVQPGQQYTNADRLGHEIGDLLEVVDLALREGIVHPEAIEAGRRNKRRQLARFMQTDPVAATIPLGAAVVATAAEGSARPSDCPRGNACCGHLLSLARGGQQVSTCGLRGCLHNHDTVLGGCGKDNV